MNTGRGSGAPPPRPAPPPPLPPHPVPTLFPRPALLAAAVLLAPPATDDRDSSGQDPPTLGAGEGATLEVPRERPAGPDEPLSRAIERGLEYLAREVALRGDGMLATGDPDHAAPVGVTALGSLAFMAGGSTPTRGPHQRPLARTLNYLLSKVRPEDDEHAGYVTDLGSDLKSKMHGHGLALLAFTQAYALSPGSPRGRRLAQAIEQGVRRIELAQGPDGGWYYEPEPFDVHEGSVTVCLLWALRGARNVGFQVDEGVVQRALRYVESLQDEQGGFIYSKQSPRSSVALTAACLSTLHALGIYEGRMIDDGYLYVWRHLALREQDRGRGLLGSQSRFPFYERLYLAQALWQHPDEQVFRRWAEEETKRVLVAQRENGSWLDRRYDAAGRKLESRYGAPYATAMNVLYLSVPEGRLPIFQR